MTSREGGCLCGAVRYELEGSPQATVVCHCTHCQKASGSAFSVNLLVQRQQYTQHGKTRIFVDTGDSGLPSNRHFCEQCGSPVITEAGNLPGMVLVKFGTLDQRQDLLPQLEIYTTHAAAWQRPVEGAARCLGAPEA